MLESPEVAPELTAFASIALKEWQITIDALISGEAPLLVRKGGIRETNHSFNCLHPCAVLLPTFEHQALSALKASIQKKVNLQNPGMRSTRDGQNTPPPPKRSTPISLRAWAEFTQVFQINTSQHLQALKPYHIWNDEFITRRFEWKPTQPLWGILCRVHQFLTPITLEMQPTFGGCRSWIPLAQSIALTQSRPIFSDLKFDAFSQAVLKLMG